MTTAMPPPAREPLSARRVLVTGASAGIGESTARALTARGARVALVARRGERLAELAAELPGAVAVPADLTDDAAAAAAVHTAADAFGGLDAVVNAAGVFHGGPVLGDEPSTPDQWRRMFGLNVVALLVVTRAAAEHLERGTEPAVVCVSSMSGRRVPNPAGAVYAASKHAVHAVTEGLRAELAPRGVRVTTVSPGFVRTGIVDGWSDGALRDRYTERLATVGLDPAVVADGIVHVLASPAQVVEYALTSVTQ
ncbi:MULTISPECIES: SDR family oxidoreductase [unclassified Pseudonocardia]|uniref:SDR family oxidoreductase n=1 Tax=unclassified Pseudonocardia TaxID=2619320 RepID=UPI000B2A26BE|nr:MULTISPECIES: SDR family oxidoreductase [unclassified Pseudonocardia]